MRRHPGQTGQALSGQLAEVLGLRSGSSGSTLCQHFLLKYYFVFDLGFDPGRPGLDDLDTRVKRRGALDGKPCYSMVYHGLPW